MLSNMQTTSSPFNTERALSEEYSTVAKLTSHNPFKARSNGQPSGPIY